MFYFIPSWKKENHSFQSMITPWYQNLGYVEFDDTVHQIRMFFQEQISTAILICTYFPQLRYFLHQQNIFEVPYISVFDEMQGITEESMNVVTLSDFYWEETDEFIHTPFLIVVKRQGDLYAKVDFGEDGNIIYISYYEQNQMSKRYYMDDRGFISSICYYQDDSELYQEYLNLQGEWQFREYKLKNDSHVEINPLSDYSFQNTYYPSIEALVKEVLVHYLRPMYSQDILVVAMDKSNYMLVEGVDFSAKLVLSFFSQRPHAEHLESLNADLMIVDTMKKKQWLQSQLGSKTEIYEITSFDTRLTLGKSQQMKELEILFMIDDLEIEEVKTYINRIIYKMVTNKNIILTLASYRNAHLLSEYEQHAQELWDSCQLQEMDEGIDVLGLQVEKTYPIKAVAFYKEADIIKQLEHTRLIIDLSKEPHTFIQIAAISTGIPQINNVYSDYVVNYENGLIMQEKQEIDEVIDFYLLNLSNWNKALVYSIQMAEQYSSTAIVEKWQQLLSENRNG